MNFKYGEDREEKIDKFLDTVAWWHSEKEHPTGLYSTIGRAEKHLELLNKNIEEFNKSSTELTKVLNKITLYGVIVAALGILVGSASFIFELIKYLEK
jgi:hypothetical protein